MLEIIGCIVANILLFVCFKWFALSRIQSFAAIVVNYWVCLVFGSLVVGHVPLLRYDLDTSWVPYGIVLGVLFISGFNFAALSVRYTGMAVTTVMQKMSLIISSAFAIVFFHESTGFLKLSGILLSLLAIVLISVQDKNSAKNGALGPYFVYPFLTLVFSGLIESILYHVKAKGLSFNADAELTTFAFSVAATVGAVVLIARYAKGGLRFQWRDYYGGILLGIPNFFSIYLILLILQQGFEGSVVFPVLNISVLVCTALLGLWVFHERLKMVNYIGIAAALVAILAIMIP